MTSSARQGLAKRKPYAMLSYSPSSSSCTSEVGYLQIDNYAALKKKLKFVDSSHARWVTLPKGTDVVSYPRSHNSATGAQTQKATQQPLRSCLKQKQHVSKDEDASSTPRSTSSGCTDSTHASSSDIRHVHFCDGGVPGIEDNAPSARSLSSTDEWIYIDRDICGFSLYEYAPYAPAFRDFASSRFAWAFLTEMDTVETLSLVQHAENMTNKSYLARYMSEEKALNEALKLAGVKKEVLA